MTAEKRSEYRLSRYVKVIPYDGKQILLYNVSTGKLYVAAEEKREQIEQFLKKNTVLDADIQNRMIGERLIVDINFDEVGLCELEFNKMAYSRETLDITIIPTNDCNFKCVYCYEKHKKEYMSMDTAASIINYYKKNARFCKYLIVSWFGGEPLLNIDIMEHIMRELLEISKAHGVVVRTMVTTNGYLLSHEVFERLLKVGVRNYQITIDGLQETHNVQRPHVNNRDSFQRIIANLDTIMQCNQKQRYEISIRFNISKEMDRNKEKILDFFAEKYKNWKQLSFIFEWIRDWGGESLNRTIVTTPSICIEWIKTAKEKGMRCFDLFQNSCGMYFCEACKLNGFIIDFDGGIHKCTLAMEDEKYKQLNKIGVLRKNGEIQFNGNIIAWFKRNKRDKCTECVYYPICMGINCPLDTIIKQNTHCLPHKDLMEKYIDSLYMRGQYIVL